MTKIEQKLIGSGYKLTGPRLKIIKYLSLNHSPISARALRKRIKTVDQASVYRLLNLLEELQAINVETVKKEKLYCLSEEPHHHIVCRECGYTEVVECNHNFDHYKNFNDVYHRLTLTGICDKCAKQKR